MDDDGRLTVPESDRAAEELSSREAELREEIERQKHEKAVLEERHQFEILERLKVKDELQEYKAEVISELRSKNGELESRISRLEEGIGGRLRKRRMGERRSQRLANMEAENRERENEDVEEDEVDVDGSGGTASEEDSSPPQPPPRRGRGRPRKMSGNEKEMTKTRKDETEDAEEDEVDLDSDGSGSTESEGDSSPSPPPRRTRDCPRTKGNANLQVSGNKKQMKKIGRRKRVWKQKYKDADHVQYRCNMLAFLKIMQKAKKHLTKSHLELLQQTPFWPLISAFYNGMISENDCKKSESDINDIIRCYNSNSKCFEFGSSSVSLTPEDISVILGLPQEGETLKVRGLFGVNKYTSDFVERYFKDEKRVKKKMVDDGLDKALQGERETDREDVLRLIILELFITFLFCNAGSTIGWKLVRCCEELENMSRYSWAKAVADFLSSTLEKSSRQYGPYSTGGCVIVLLFWLCERTNLIQPVEGRESHTPALIKWNIQELHLKLQRMKDFDNLGRSFEGVKENQKRNGEDEEDGKGIGENEETEEDIREETETDRGGEESVSDGNMVCPLEKELRAQMSHFRQSFPILNIGNEDLGKEKAKDLRDKVRNARMEVERAQIKVDRLAEKLERRKEKSTKLKRKLKEEKKEKRRLEEENEILNAEKRLLFESVTKLVKKMEDTLDAERKALRNLVKEKAEVIKENQQLKDQLNQGSCTTAAKVGENTQTQFSPEYSHVTSPEKSFQKRALDPGFDYDKVREKKMKLGDDKEERNRGDVQSDASGIFS